MFSDQLPRHDVRITLGVAYLPGWLMLNQQSGTITQPRDIARDLAGTPLAMTRPQLKSDQMQVFMPHLGRMWATNLYRYVTRADGIRVPPVPGNPLELAIEAFDAAALYDESLNQWLSIFRPDMALANYYPPGATMGMHQDRNENPFAPTVSFSIGDEVLFRIGGTENRSKPWDDVTLASGDVITFDGPKRLAFHGVPKTRPGALPKAYGFEEGRINITSRQVRG